MSRSGFLSRVLALLTPQELRHGLLVLALMLTLALFETAGVASVVPFLAVLGNPDMIESNALLSWLYALGQFEATNTFLLALGIGAFAMILTSAVVRTVTTYVMNRFVQMRSASVSTRLMENYLAQPYEYFLGRNSADLSKTIISEVTTVVNQVMKPLMELGSSGLVVLILTALLLLVDPVVTVLIALIFGAVYGGTYLTVRNLVQRMGHGRVQANRKRFLIASEAFSGIKDLKVLGRERTYLSRFRASAVRYSRLVYRQAILAAVPRYAVEALAFGGILILALILLAARQDLGEILPLLGLYTLGGYRLLPAAQRIYASANALRFGSPAVDLVYRDLVSIRVSPPPATEASPVPLLEQEIRFDRVSYSYPDQRSQAVSEISLTIRAKSVVGLVGRTGAGKTTIVDLILGLVRPHEGRILVDSVPLTDGMLSAWRRRIGYVPQTVYLADASVAANIAFGVAPHLVDPASVERAARIANIHDFVMEKLPVGYRTKVGDRGVRLSGGQRQRIGIARALYHDPALLVLDEATAALDAATEEAILQSLFVGSDGAKTVVLIAHRLSTIQHCDQLLVMEHGRIADTGTFDELRRSSTAFRRVAVA